MSVPDRGSEGLLFEHCFAATSGRKALHSSNFWSSGRRLLSSYMIIILWGGGPDKDQKLSDECPARGSWNECTLCIATRPRPERYALHSSFFFLTIFCLWAGST